MDLGQLPGRFALQRWEAMLGLLAGITVLLLLVSEVAALAPTPSAKRLRPLALWASLLVLVIFGAAWLAHLRGVLDAAP